MRVHCVCQVGLSLNASRGSRPTAGDPAAPQRLQQGVHRRGTQARLRRGAEEDTVPPRVQLAELHDAIRSHRASGFETEPTSKVRGELSRSRGRVCRARSRNGSSDIDNVPPGTIVDSNITEAQPQHRSAGGHEHDSAFRHEHHFA
eukprot:1886606-Pleurochrysis_carterae.AAC.1